MRILVILVLLLLIGSCKSPVRALVQQQARYDWEHIHEEGVECVRDMQYFRNAAGCWAICHPANHFSASWLPCTDEVEALIAEQADTSTVPDPIVDE